MTLIAVHTTDEYAEIVTDTLAYGDFCVNVDFFEFKTSFVSHREGPDTAWMTQGSCEFGALVASSVGAFPRTDGFDVFVDRVESIDLQGLWERVQDAGRADRAPVENWAGTLFVVGYSSAAASFRTYAYANESGFARIDLSGMFVMPAPVRSIRPGPIEIPRLKRSISNAYDDAETAEILAGLLELPAPSAPTSDAEWVHLALEVRRDRARSPVGSAFKTAIGGALLRWRIPRTPRTVVEAVDCLHVFDELTDPEGCPDFRRVVAGTLHPHAQADPCPCDSGDRQIDCCVTLRLLNGPCPCRDGRGLPFKDCCSINADAAGIP